jgi:hypothetical protein
LIGQGVFQVEEKQAIFLPSLLRCPNPTYASERALPMFFNCYLSFSQPVQPIPINNFALMTSNPKNEKKEALAKAVFQPDNLVWLAVLLMLFTFFRVLYYL